MAKINTVKDIHALVNPIFKEQLGLETILAEDLSNLIDVGKEIANGDTGVDNYVKAMVHTVGRMNFNDRVYTGGAPDVYRDGWEYGAIREKVRMEPPEAIADPAWDLRNGQSYDDQIFYAPTVKAKFFDKSATYMIPLSFPWEETIKPSLLNASGLARFIAMIETQVTNTRRVQNDALIMRTINNFTAATIASEYPGGDYAARSGVRAINLLYKYNTEYGGGLSKEGCMNDPGFLRYCGRIMKNYVRYLEQQNVLLNIGGTNKFTPRDSLHVVLLKDFESAVETNMQADTWHKDLVELPFHENVVAWQGVGTGFEWTDLSKINVTTSEETPHTVTLDNVIGVMFDRDALGITNESDRITTYVSKSADFYTNRYKYKSSYFNDFDEQFIVFFIA